MMIARPWSFAGIAALGIAAVAGLFSWGREHRHSTELAANNQMLSTSLSQMQLKLDAVSRELTDLEKQRTEPPPPAAAPVRTETQRPAVRVVRQAPRPVDDPRINQLKTQLSEQQKELASAKDDIASTREQLQQAEGDLQGKLDASHTELSGSIARTHDELVALERRGERNFYEFQMDKSKEFQKVGPVRVSLRKADVKHKTYNLVMMVDDVQIEKKNVNLFEPVWISVEDRPEPLQLIVNQVHKDQIAGYLSEPKFKKSDLAASADRQPVGTAVQQ